MLPCSRNHCLLIKGSTHLSALLPTFPLYLFLDYKISSLPARARLKKGKSSARLHLIPGAIFGTTSCLQGRPLCQQEKKRIKVKMVEGFRAWAGSKVKVLLPHAMKEESSEMWGPLSLIGALISSLYFRGGKKSQRMVRIEENN